MSNLLKEAIADAKAVRETALQNAKMALEEAFTPQLKSMLSAKLKEDEFGDEEEEVAVDDEEEVPAEDVPDEEEVESYEDIEAGGEEEDLGGEEEAEEDDLDLEAVIRELESELSEGEDEEEAEEEPVEETVSINGKIYSLVKEEEGEEESDDDEVEVDESVFTEGDDEEEDEETVDEQSSSSQIGAGDNKVDVADANDEEDPEGGPGVPIASMGESVDSLTTQLAEYKEAVSFLKDKLHEVNILNAKLLFTNKLFKEFVLDNNQKLKVVETFDRAQSTREIKLVYSTLAEQFSDNGSINKKKSITESASSKSGSTKPSKESSKVISEENQVANRFKKLAGIING